MSKEIFNKGDRLEFAAAAYFQSHGFLVRRAVRLSVAAGTAEATDIDLLAFRYSNPLSEERVVVDCRDRRKPRPFERILWALGLSAFVRADRVVVVSPRAPWQAREFASQASVEILGNDEIHTHLDNGAPGYIPFSDASQEIDSDFKDKVKKSGLEAKALLRQISKVRQMLVVGHPLTNFNRILKMISEVHSGSFRKSKAKPLGQYVLYDAAVICAAMLLRFIEETKWTLRADRADYVSKKLIYGDTPPAKAQELAKASIGKSFPDIFPTPKYADETIHLIDALVDKPVVSAKLPYGVDYYLFAHLLEKVPKNNVDPYLGSDQNETIKMSKKFLSLLAFAAEVPNSVWDPVMPVDKNEKQSMPIQKRLL